MKKRAGGKRGGRARGRRGNIAGFLVLVFIAVGLWLGSGLIEEYGPFTPRTLDEEVPETPRIPEPGDRIRVEVLNAGGIRGMAAIARDELRDAGFDVVAVGNATSFGAEGSAVLLRAGDPDAALAVAGALGIDEVRIEPDTTLLVEVTVLLGSTWRSRAEREEEG